MTGIAQQAVVIVVGILVLLVGLAGLVLGVGIDGIKSYIGIESEPVTSAPPSTHRRVKFAPSKHIREFVKSTREWKGAERTERV